MLAALSKLLSMACLETVEDLGIGKRKLTKPNQAVFFKAVTARALDVLVVVEMDGSGLYKEWASAAIMAAYEDQVLRPQHVTAFLLKQDEWVFGDYKGRINVFTRRLLMRQFHRVMASMLDPLSSGSLERTPHHTWQYVVGRLLALLGGGGMEVSTLCSLAVLALVDVLRSLPLGAYPVRGRGL